MTLVLGAILFWSCLKEFEVGKIELLVVLCLVYIVGGCRPEGELDMRIQVHLSRVEVIDVLV